MHLITITSTLSGTIHSLKTKLAVSFDTYKMLQILQNGMLLTELNTGMISEKTPIGTQHINFLTTTTNPILAPPIPNTHI
jgi:hypothetical protein